MIIFINGKQKRVPRQELIDGRSEEGFLRANADSIWLHQQGLWHLMPENVESEAADATADSTGGASSPGDDIPF